MPPTRTACRRAACPSTRKTASCTGASSRARPSGWPARNSTSSISRRRFPPTTPACAPRGRWTCRWWRPTTRISRNTSTTTCRPAAAAAARHRPAHRPRPVQPARRRRRAVAGHAHDPGRLRRQRSPCTCSPPASRSDKFRQGDGARFRAAHGIAADRPVALFVGRVAHEKNIGFLLDAMAQVRHRLPARAAGRRRRRPGPAGLEAQRPTRWASRTRSASSAISTAPHESARLLRRRRRLRFRLQDRNPRPRAARSDGGRPARLRARRDGHARHPRTAPRRRRRARSMRPNSPPASPTC